MIRIIKNISQIKDYIQQVLYQFDVWYHHDVY